MIWGLLIAVAAGAVYYADLRRRPFKKCGHCGGSGKLPGALMAGTYGYCGRCGGKGEVRRWGAPREVRR